MTTQEIYSLANELTEKGISNVLSGWSNDNETKQMIMKKEISDIIEKHVNLPAFYGGNAANEIIALLSAYLCEEASKCHNEQLIAQFATMTDRVALREYWNGKKQGFEAVKKFIGT